MQRRLLLFGFAAAFLTLVIVAAPCDAFAQSERFEDNVLFIVLYQREAYGELPNSAYMIQKGGEIFYKEAWARPDEWGPHLEKLVAGRE